MSHFCDWSGDGIRWGSHVVFPAPRVHGPGGRFNGIRHITLTHGHQNRQALPARVISDLCWLPSPGVRAHECEHAVASHEQY